MKVLAASWLLPALIALPLLFAALLLGLRRLGDLAASLLGAFGATLTLALAVWAAWEGPVGAAHDGVSGAPGASPHLVVDREWIAALGVHAHLGLDGVSAPLVLLTAALTALVCWQLVRVRPVSGRPGGLIACFLVVESGAIATFTALDLLVFFIAFEVVLVPMWFVIAFWGDDRQPPTSAPPAAPQTGGETARREAANRFILFTVTGSAVMLLGLLLVALNAGTTDLTELAARSGFGLGVGVQTLAATLIVAGLAVKAPMFPLHTWLPPAHTIAPTGGSVLLAGVLLKMGTYGLVRVVVPVLPAGMRAIAPVLGVLGVIGIIWGGLACFVERDLKRLIAFSSVAHMGFVLLGVASMTPAGLQGALFANVAHGLITGLLFVTVGALKDRHHSADLRVLGSGLRDRLPRLGWLLAFGAIAGLGLPGLAGFWGELLAIVGSWHSAALGGFGPALAVGAAFGTALAAVYLLRVLRLLWHGPVPPPVGLEAGLEAELGTGVTIGDATRFELAIVTPLVAGTLALGVLPWILLDLTGPAVRALLIGPGTP